MGIVRLLGITTITLFITACAQQQTVQTDLPERGSADFYKVRNSVADEVYVDPNFEKGNSLSSVRKLYIGTADTSSTQIIQPPNVRSSDIDAWVMDAEEDALLQASMATEFTSALGYEGAFTLVSERTDAELILQSTIIALHPNVPRSVVEAGGKGGGSITMSFAFLHPDTGKVMIRMLDSKSTDDIWAFDNIEGDMSAVDLIYQSWGHQLRRGLMFLQGRLNDPTMGPMQLKPQK